MDSLRLNMLLFQTLSLSFCYMPKTSSELTAPILLGFFVLFVGFCIGSWFDLYVRFSFFDTLMHFWGGLTVAFFFARYFKDASPHLSAFKKILFLIASACLIGVFWECAEYTSSVLSPIYAPLISNYFYIGTLADTLTDLVADMLGGFAFALLWITKK